jgi:hypothetical protein
MDRTLMAGALVFRVAGAEMAPMIGCIYHKGVIQFASLRQGIKKTSEIPVATIASAKIIRIIFPPITFCAL